MRSDSHMFEIVRVPRADMTAMVRHRVFRCDYLDRSNTDLRTDTGAAGSMNQRPLTADELEKLSEYLWQFTMFNNSDYAVESSARSTSGNYAGANHPHGSARARRERRLRHRAARRLDAHDEFHRRHAHALTEQRAYVPGEGQHFGGDELHGLIWASTPG